MENCLVGQRISKARIKLGMSTQELAERIGKSQATVSRIENGKQGVNLPLLDKISKVLRIHVVTLLGEDAAACHSLQRLGIFLQSILGTGRQRAHLTLEAVSVQLGISLERLVSFESGSLLPEPEELEALCVLYSVDLNVANQVYIAEQKCPLLVSRLSTMNALLEDCLDLLRDSSQEGKTSRVGGLTKRIETCLADFSCERQGEYFSIGHLSDQLMKALQDPDFHAKAEELARQWKMLAAEAGAANKPYAQASRSESGEENIEETAPAYRADKRLRDSAGVSDRINPQAVYYTQKPRGPDKS